MLRTKKNVFMSRRNWFSSRCCCCCCCWWRYSLSCRGHRLYWRPYTLEVVSTILRVCVCVCARARARLYLRRCRDMNSLAGRHRQPGVKTKISFSRVYILLWCILYVA